MRYDLYGERASLTTGERNMRFIEMTPNSTGIVYRAHPIPHTPSACDNGLIVLQPLISLEIPFNGLVDKFFVEAPDVL
jgi:hypothetical protein